MAKKVTHKDLQKVFYMTQDYLAFFSVVEGIRDVGIIGLNKRKITEVAGTPTIAVKNLPYLVRIRIIQLFLKQNKSECVLIKCNDNSYFIVNKKAIERTKKFLKKPRSFNKKYHSDLGELLGYPPCCIKKFLNTGAHKKRPFNPLPYVPCSKSCKESKKYTKQYNKMMKKYGLKRTDVNIII